MGDVEGGGDAAPGLRGARRAGSPGDRATARLVWTAPARHQRASRPAARPGRRVARKLETGDWSRTSRVSGLGSYGKEVFDDPGWTAAQLCEWNMAEVTHDRVSRRAQPRDRRRAGARAAFFARRGGRGGAGRARSLRCVAAHPGDPAHPISVPAEGA